MNGEQKERKKLATYRNLFLDFLNFPRRVELILILPFPVYTYSFQFLESHVSNRSRTANLTSVALIFVEAVDQKKAVI